MGHGIILNIDRVSAHKDIDLDLSLYHIMRFEHLKSIFQTKTIRISKVISWTDTFEYPIRAISDERKELISKNLFGYCMTKNYDIESLWKLHGTNTNTGLFDKKTICIKLNPEKFCKSIYEGFLKEFPELNDIKCFPFFNMFLGPVKYLDLKNDEMHKIYELEDKCYYPDYMYPAFLKRRNFENEQEIRLIFYNLKFNVENKNSIFIPLGNTDFISEVIINPFIDGDEFTSFMREINDTLRTDISCSKSRLFESIRDEIKLENEDIKYWGQAKMAKVIIPKI